MPLRQKDGGYRWGAAQWRWPVGGVTAICVFAAAYQPRINAAWGIENAARPIRCNAPACLVPDEGIEPPTFGLQNRIYSPVINDVSNVCRVSVAAA
jgi:hypothetical protein